MNLRNLSIGLQLERIHIHIKLDTNIKHPPALHGLLGH
jgi:hypothetical protein